MTGESSKPRYELQIDLSVLDHLGINLYSNVPAVMTEMVANAWDADSKEVKITINIDDDFIEVLDNGNGMTADDINRKFLTVGYRRRDEDAAGGVSEGGRPVMGRKGVGKLAPFSIAEIVEVFSTKQGERCGLSMSTDGIRQSKKDKSTYHPSEMDSSELIPEKGTRIILRKLKRERVRKSNLRERLARRFSVIGTDEFKVYIDGAEVTSRDRGDLTSLQYIWTIGDWQKPAWSEPNRISTLRDSLEGWADEWKIKGWIGTSQKPKDLEKAAGNLNGIVVVARGRLFQENILGEINDGRHYTKYLTGQLEADFLDATADDIATSDRQRVIEDDPRYVGLRVYLKAVLNDLESQWSKWRTEDDPEVVKSQYPEVAAWVNGLEEGYRKHADRMVGAIERMPFPKEQKEEVLKHAIFGFERLKLRGMTEEMAHAIEVGDAAIVKLFADQDTIEATLYRDIVKGRLETIKVLRDAVDKDEREKVLQQILFDRLWLLDSSWERASGTEEIEKQFKSIFPPSADGSDDDASKGRFDICYQTVPGKHVIVELKRASRQMKLEELYTQGSGYVDELKRLLLQHGMTKAGTDPDVEVVFVLGDTVPEQMSNPPRYKGMMDAINPGSRICTYEELISRALFQYSEYLDRTKDLDRLSAVIESIGRPTT